MTGLSLFFKIYNVGIDAYQHLGLKKLEVLSVHNVVFECKEDWALKNCLTLELTIKWLFIISFEVNSLDDIIIAVVKKVQFF